MNTAYTLPKDIAVKVLAEAATIGKVKLDMLDCAISYARIPTTKTLPQILLLSEDTPTHYNFIYRDQSFLQPPKSEADDLDSQSKDYWDVGLSTVSAVSFFVWIKLNIEDGWKLVEKYKLELNEW